MVNICWQKHPVFLWLGYSKNQLFKVPKFELKIEKMYYFVYVLTLHGCYRES